MLIRKMIKKNRIIKTRSNIKIKLKKILKDETEKKK